MTSRSVLEDILPPHRKDIAWFVLTCIGLFLAVIVGYSI